jgi:hypothetical protein
VLPSADKDEKRQVFYKYLCKLLPFIETPDMEYPSGSKMARVAAQLDYYLPFRQCAPTMKRAMEVLYSDHNRLLTSQGFANILAFRGIFYGSDFAQSDDFRYFNNKEEWDDFYNEKEGVLGTEEKEDAVKRREEKKQQKAPKRTKSAKQLEEEENCRRGTTEDYFRDMGIYGTSNVRRSTSLFDKYWEVSTSEFWKGSKTVPWEAFIQTNPSPRELYDWLMVGGRFPNIGGLTALLIVGDLIEAGVIRMSSPDEWGLLVVAVNKGAKKGLEDLGLINTNSPNPTIVQEFKALNDFLLEKLTQEQKEIMHYNVVMLEHGLCKHPRFVQIRVKKK